MPMRNSVFGFDQPEDSPGFLLWQTTITWQRLIKKALEPYDIAHAQFVILAITLWLEAQGDAVSQSSIIRQSKLDKMTVSQSLKKLVAVGYVKRQEHHKDTRAKSVSLTTKGKMLIVKLVPIVEAIDTTFFGILKKSKQQSLIDILNELTVTPIVDE
jgi:DNA-binding MarR family transcriptional regulator